ncbi:zinc finger protein 423-like, partial [Brachionus plicatilis]
MSSRRKQFKPKSAIDVVDGGGGGGGGDEADKADQSANMSYSAMVSSTNEPSDECNERKRKRSTSDADGDESDSGSGSDSVLHNDTMNDIDEFEDGVAGFERLNQTTPHSSDYLDHSDYSQLNHSVMLLMFKCRVCGKGFKHRRSLNRHVKLHSGEKNFKCPFCTTAFARSDHLKAHIRTHNNSKPYRCSICQCGYSTQAALKVHIAHHHSKSKFKCVLCNELEFHSQLALEGH